MTIDLFQHAETPDPVLGISLSLLALPLDEEIINIFFNFENIGEEQACNSDPALQLTVNVNVKKLRPFGNQPSQSFPFPEDALLVSK